MNLENIRVSSLSFRDESANSSTCDSQRQWKKYQHMHVWHSEWRLQPKRKRRRLRYYVMSFNILSTRELSRICWDSHIPANKNDKSTQRAKSEQGVRIQYCTVCPRIFAPVSNCPLCVPANYNTVFPYFWRDINKPQSSGRNLAQ
jgi:hypothetical protein